VAVSAALFERCRLAIAPDCGAAHLAGAVGTATLRLYGPASTRVYGPWPADPRQVALSAADLACVPCGFMAGPPCGAAQYPACMLAHGPRRVVQLANGLLASTEN
jgi:ADP-heptose:LPS heptosyltransferase